MCVTCKFVGDLSASLYWQVDLQASGDRQVIVLLELAMDLDGINGWSISLVRRPRLLCDRPTRAWPAPEVRHHRCGDARSRRMNDAVQTNEALPFPVRPAKKRNNPSHRRKGRRQEEQRKDTQVRPSQFFVRSAFLFL